MARKRNKRLLSKGFRDLEFLPSGRCGWDCTLAGMAYGARMGIERRQPDLNAWAARHGAAAGKRYQDLGVDALVLWHGTSRQRAEKIIEHGLFHKKGLWTTTDPFIAHSFCRSRSERFGIEGAMACLVLDRGAFIEGEDYEIEGNGNVLRFHYGLPPEVVEYVILHDEIRFTGDGRARHPVAWLKARFKKRSGIWLPVQRIPVKYLDSAAYSSMEEFIRICLQRLLNELNEVSALEVFSTLYGLVSPWDALAHEDVIALIEENCSPYRQRGKWQTLRDRNAMRAS